MPRLAISVVTLALAACHGSNPDLRDDELRDPTLYEGSSFNEVRAAIFDGPYASLPVHSVDTARFYRGAEDLFERTVQDLFNNTHDHHPHYNRLLHPNGICFTGTWAIDEETPFTGLFSTGTQALVIARASTAFSATRRGEPRAFAFAMKLFPTTAGHVVVKPVNLFTFDRMLGEDRDHWTDAELTNEPPSGGPLAPSLFGVAQKVAWETLKVDAVGRRPLHPAAQSGLDDPTTAVTPMKLTLVLEDKPSADDEDFRDELRALVGKAPLKYALRVQGEARSPFRGPPVTTGDAQTIGHLTLTAAVASSGCDHRVRFHHVVNP